MDPLADVLDITRVSGVVLANVTARAPWGVTTPGMSSATFHAVTGGTCWMRVEDQPPRQLLPGDLVLFPTGAEHELVSAPDEPAIRYQSLVDRHGISPEGDLELPGTGACTQFLCARYDFDDQVSQPLLSLLPPALVVSAGDPTSDAAIQSTLRLLALELTSTTPGRRAVVERLVDVLFVHALRTWMESGTAEASAASWMTALRDPVVARSLGVIHAEPARAWTVNSLAADVGVSRATLARRFLELVGETPIAYLTRWRMDLAARLLRETAESVGSVGRQVGYRSEHAFSRAFSRERGLPPSDYRDHQQAGAATSVFRGHSS